MILWIDVPWRNRFFEAYEIHRASQIFKLLSLTSKKVRILVFVRNFYVWGKLGDESAPSPNIELVIGHVLFVASITAKK